MNRGPSRLLSAPFVLLYVAAMAALALNFGRHRWWDAAWFPIAVGIVAATAIIVLVRLSGELSRSGNWMYDWRGITVLGTGSALAAAAGIWLASQRSILPAALLLCCGATMLLGAIGTALRWRGFRAPPEPGECLHCGYNLTGNESGVCPECGTEVDDLDLP